MEPPEIEQAAFLDLYMYQAGLGNTPKQWHFWSAVSLLAACMGNNFWVIVDGKVLYPNQYIFLVGESGAGKGDAINPATDYIHDDDPYVRKNCTNNITKQGAASHLMEFYPEKPTDHIHGSRMWLVTDELADAIHAGPLGMDLIKAMTAWYSGKKGKNWDMTRTGGSQHIISPMLNWLAGSTEDWLFASLDPTAISGGFFGRTLVIYGKKETDHPATSFPYNRLAVQTELLARIEILRRIKSELIFHPEAWKHYIDWYPTRIKSDDPDKSAIHNRDNAMVWKLSMIAYISESLTLSRKFTNEIQIKHVELAIQWLYEARKDLDIILKQAYRSRETIAMDKTLEIITKFRTIQRSLLIGKLDRLGVRSPELNSIIMTLKDRNQITEYTTNSRATMYTIKKRKGM